MLIPDFFRSLHPVLQALVATLFTWGVTALGAASVFLTRSISRKVLDGMLGFAAGVMVAASFWSLLAPAIELAEEQGLPGWMPAVVGFMIGGLVLFGIDKLLPHLHLDRAVEDAEGIRTAWRRAVLLVLAITLHNFPEGLAVGVAFGAAASGLPATSVASAIALAIGIGLQNFPEGIAVAMPLRGEGMGKFRSFLYGQASAVVEPVAGILGAAAALAFRPLLPYALSFAAGAMIYVVVEELVPASHENGHTDVATLAALGGFAVMMILDVSLG